MIIQRPRLLQSINGALRKFPVVTLLGARQVGKTTLARQIAAASSELTTTYDLETTRGQDALTDTPEMLLEESRGLVIIDEVQRMPELFTLLRPICDNPNRRAQFLLLGSASPQVVRGVSESLAGRVKYIDVSGLSLDEVGAENQYKLWLRGGFPRSYLETSAGEAHDWLDSFIHTFLERDVLRLDSGISPSMIGRFWKMLAHRHGQTWSTSEFSKSLGISERVVNGFRDVLVGLFMVRSLPAWFENLGKRLVKRPKVYIRDSGILHFLLRLPSFSELLSHPTYGASWEGFALEQLLSMHGGREAYFYRTQRGTELDLLLLRNGKKWGFEFKCADAPRTTKAMHIAIDDLDLAHLWMVYPGDLSYPVSEKITALPLREISNLDFSSKC